MKNRTGRSETDDSELTLYQLHCRYAILRGLDMARAADLWHEMKSEGLNREAHLDALFARLDGIVPLAAQSSVNTAVEQSAKEGQEILEESRRRLRNPALAACRLELDNFKCQHCRFAIPRTLHGPAGPVALEHRILEVHHINPVRDGERLTRLADLVTLCPTCHRLLHAVGSALGYSELPLSLLGLVDAASGPTEAHDGQSH